MVIMKADYMYIPSTCVQNTSDCVPYQHQLDTLLHSCVILSRASTYIRNKVKSGAGTANSSCENYKTEKHTKMTSAVASL